MGLVTSSRSSRGIQRGTVRGCIGWCKRRNFVSSGQSQIGGRPIGLKLEGRGRIPSAIPGGGGIEIRSRGFSRVIGRAQMGQSRKAFSDAGLNVRIHLPPALQRRVCELSVPERRTTYCRLASYKVRYRPRLCGNMIGVRFDPLSAGRIAGKGRSVIRGSSPDHFQ